MEEPWLGPAILMRSYYLPFSIVTDAAWDLHCREREGDLNEESASFRHQGTASITLSRTGRLTVGGFN